MVNLVAGRRRPVGSSTNQSTLVHGGGNMLLLSMRKLADLVAYCIPYEFEDVITELTGADRVDVGDEDALEFSRRSYKLVRMTSGSSGLARKWAPSPSVVHLERDYDLFFPIFNHPHELFALTTIPNWRRRSRIAACYVSELWVHLLPRYLLELLGQFDHVFLGVGGLEREVGQIINRPVSYLPLASDLFKFSPWPNYPTRAIDVTNIGRRSPTTHGALLQLARERRLFYYYDTVAASGIDRKQRTFRVEDASEHRTMYSSLLTRTRYFVANRARINEPEFTNGRHEISARYYEGAAAGVVMIGEPPETEQFKREFDWEDAVIRVPFNSPDIGAILAELDRDTQRIEAARRNNICNAALRHDWVHRLRDVFDTLGVPPTEAMLERERRLQTMATMVRNGVADPAAARARAPGGRAPSLATAA
jgi:hypothetical protein